MDDGNDDPQEKYLGLTATQFNIAFFAVVGAIALAVFVYFGGVGAVKDFVSDEEPSANIVVVDGAGTPTPQSSEATPTPSPEEPQFGEAVGSLFGTFDPLSLIGTMGSGVPDAAPAQSQGGGDGLDSALLRQDDLPLGFFGFGEMSFNIPIEDGSADMAANMFASGDLASGEFGTMVMSMALAAPPGSLDELDELDELGDLSGLEPAEIDEMAGAMEQFGISIRDFRLLDASGLGEGGVGMHMEMEFGGLFEAFGAPQEDIPFDAIAWDMYMFASGERMLMVAVMWPAGVASGVDSRALAEVVSVRAGS